MFALCLRAPNDKNGNPRRVWLVYVNALECVPRYIVSEGYAGRRGVADALIRVDGDVAALPGPEATRNVIDCAPVFDVPAAQHKQYAKGWTVIHA